MGDSSLPGQGGAGGCNLTQLLQEAAAGNGDAAERLLPLIYEQLRAIAKQRMSGERRGHTLQATALVHEAYVRLIGDGDAAWANRAHFFHTAAECMRRILIEHARKRGRRKRGGHGRRLPLDMVDLTAEEHIDEILAVDEAIGRLELQDTQAAEVVKLRFFAGLSVEEVADVQGTSPRSVARDWAYARAWLYRAMAEPDH